MSGNSASRPTHTACLSRITATMLAMTATVKAIDSQRWVCRIHMFQLIGYSLFEKRDEATSVRPRRQLFQLVEHLLPAEPGAAKCLPLVGPEADLLHAQEGAFGCRGERERHHALQIIGRIVMGMIPGVGQFLVRFD